MRTWVRVLKEAEMTAERDLTARIFRPDLQEVEQGPKENSEGTLDAAPPATSCTAAEELRSERHETSRPLIVPAAPRRQDRATDRKPYEAPSTDAPPDEAVMGTKPNRRTLVLTGIMVVLAFAAVSYGTYYALVGRFIMSTDDAYVRANNTIVGAQVAGHITSIAPKDNAAVKAGDLLIKIDDGDYKIAVDAARAKIATQEATVARFARQADALVSLVEQAKAQLDSMQAGVKRAQLDYDRQQQLSDRGYAPKATFEQSEATRDQSVASVQSAQAGVVSAERNIDVVKAQHVEAERQIGELHASLAKAERDLNFTEVRAAVDGVFSNRLVNEGDYIQVGQRLANLVPLDKVFIDANFKETQLGLLKPGQPVTIAVDGVSGRKFEGIVESLAPASGSVFTLLPPDNATGNFTKIVQRLPVRISVPDSVAREHLLRAGMSVVVYVDTRQTAAEMVSR